MMKDIDKRLKEDDMDKSGRKVSGKKDKKKKEKKSKDKKNKRDKKDKKKSKDTASSS